MYKKNVFSGVWQRWQFISDQGGNLALTTALLLPLLIAAAGGAIDVAHALSEKSHTQGLLDGAVLSAAAKSTADQRTEVTSFLSELTSDGSGLTSDDINNGLTLTNNADGSLTANFQQPVKTSFLSIAGYDQLTVGISATAMAATAATPAMTPCIYVLANQSQALLVNSGATVTSQKCEVEVDSVSNPAFIMNSGSTIATAEFCVKGSQYINNGGKITNFVPGCSVDADPYAGKLTEPTVPTTCNTSGALSGSSFTLQPGLDCGTTFNGSPTITFAPGLHIIKDTMIINSGSTVVATGATFYFPDANSKIQFNGNVTITASAPTSGTYNGILMFEKTSDASNNTNKQQLVFNGTGGATSLQGIIYLPNRNVTYNSTSNQTSNISLVVNTLIMNAANWLIEPYTGGSTGSSTASSGSRLVL